MREGGIGRVLVASLHQSIGDLLPARLNFYEHWLHVEGLRDGTIGLAPMSAVLSFLRQEGPDYSAVMQQAGDYAAEWSVEGLSSMERTMIEGAPLWLRRRLVARLFTRLVRATFQGSRATSRTRRGVSRIVVRNSIFCQVREPVDQPLCRYYEAAARRLFTLFGLTLDVTVQSCRGAGGTEGGCVLVVALDPADTQSREAA